MTNFIYLFIAALLLMNPQALLAGETHSHYGQAMESIKGNAAEEVQPTKSIDVGNKFCPVSGEKIPVPGQKGSMGEAVTYEYNGKIYHLCCPMCIKDFKKNPEKYSKIAEEEVAKSKHMEMQFKEKKHR